MIAKKRYYAFAFTMLILPTFVFFTSCKKILGPTKVEIEDSVRHYLPVVLGDDGFQKVAAWRDGGKVLLSAWDGLLVRFIVILPVGNHHRHVVVCLHHAHFLFQLLRVGPEIVTGTVGNVFPTTDQQTVKVIVDDAFVLWVADEADDVRMLLGILLADGSGVIR